MLRKLKLYGELAEFIGHKEFEIKANNLPQVISFLINNFPEAESYMNPKYYQVKVGNYTINTDELHDPIGQQDIHIVPVISGSGGNWGRIFTGALLLGGAFLFSPLTFANFGTTALGFTGAGIAKGVAILGGALILNGISSLLYPTQDPSTPVDDPRISFNFAGTQNTARAGTPVPIVYGEIFTGSVVISGDVDTEAVQA